MREAMEFKKLFTRQEAESALPLVRQIVADVLATAGKIRALEETDEDRPGLQSELEEHLGELEGIGCFFKDWNFTTGLVDFPSVMDGRTVFLCWRSDEDDLAWYHSTEEGFAGRKPLAKSSVGN